MPKANVAVYLSLDANRALDLVIENQGNAPARNLVVELAFPPCAITHPNLETKRIDAFCRQPKQLGPNQGLRTFVGLVDDLNEPEIATIRGYAYCDSPPRSFSWTTRSSVSLDVRMFRDIVSATDPEPRRQQKAIARAAEAVVAIASGQRYASVALVDPRISALEKRALN